jgi:outer membrane usher protein FimD/PapC
MSFESKTWFFFLFTGSWCASAATVMPFMSEINGIKAEAFVEQEADGFYLSEQELKKFTTISSDGRARLENVRANFNELTLIADLPFELISSDVNRVNSKRLKGNEKAMDRFSGLYVNYDFMATNSQYGQNKALLTDIVYSDKSGYTLRTVQQLGSQDGMVRYFTNVEFNDEKTLQTRVFGDNYSSSFAKEAGVKFFGVQVRKNYALSPDYVYYPTLTMNGKANALSTYDIYENNRLVSSGKFQRGEFSVSDYANPTSDGGDVKLVVRDANGFEQVINSSLYFSPMSLKEGETSYAVDLGKAYKNVSEFEDGFYASTSARHGFSSWTGEIGADKNNDKSSYFLGALMPTKVGNFSARVVESSSGDKSERISYDKVIRTSDYSSLRFYALKQTGNELSQFGVNYSHNRFSAFVNMFESQSSSIKTVGAGYSFGSGLSVLASLTQVNDDNVIGLRLVMPLEKNVIYASTSQNQKQSGVYGGDDDFRYSVVGTENELSRSSSVLANARNKFDSFETDVYVAKTDANDVDVKAKISGSVITDFTDYALTRPIRSGVVAAVEFEKNPLPIASVSKVHKTKLGNKTIVVDAPAYYPFSIDLDYNNIEEGQESTLDRNKYVAKKGFNSIKAKVKKAGKKVKVTCNGKELERGTVVHVDSEKLIYSSVGLYVHPQDEEIDVRVGRYKLKVDSSADAFDVCS